jgi:hypothetical protein
MWPKLTNIESEIKNKIIEYSNNINASNLNAWIRVISGAEYEPYKGLILQSNTDFKLLSAIGQGDSIYGNSQSSGAIGKDWEGKTVQTTDSRFLRPSPIVTSFNVKEGKDQISREATIQLTAYSLEQMEILQAYLMEPGYSLFIEWGWNTPDSYIQLTPIELQNLAKYASDRNLNWENLSKIRKNSNGTYDSFLGFIVGGSVSNSGENFNITVTLRGTPSLPTYLQSHRNISKINNGKVLNENKSVSLYEENELTDKGSSLIRKFGNMFNSLPTYRQTESVKSLQLTATENQFINFDKKISKEIASNYAGTFFGRIFSQGGTDASIIDVRDIGEIKIEYLYSQNRYIRMDLATDIINAIGSTDYYNIGEKRVKFKIDISNSIIGGFPYMFSTNPEKLIVPTTIPDFFQYFLQTSDIKQESEGKLKLGDVDINPDFFDKELQDFLIENTENLNQLGIQETSKYCGYLKYLFVNFDVFLSKIEQKNKNIREIYIDILNEISSGVNSFWNFQMVEGEFKPSKSNMSIGTLPSFYTDLEKTRRENALQQLYSEVGFIPFTKEAIVGDDNSAIIGDIVITVIDENWIGELPFNKNQVALFNHNGIESPFLEASLDISIPSEMANMIIAKRLSTTTNPDSAYLSVSESFFNPTRDLFIKEIDYIDVIRNKYQNILNNTNVSSGDSSQEIQDEFNSLGVTFRPKPAVVGGVAGLQTKGYDYFKNGERVTDVATINQYDNLRKRKEAAIKSENEQKVSKVTSFLEKLDIVPKTIIKNNIPDLRNLIAQNNSDSLDSLKKVFSVYCFKDSEYFDKLKNEQFSKKYNGNIKKSNPGLSHPLPINYSFKILGNSGIRRGDVFKIKGIPEKYSKYGIFQVTEIEHSLDGMQWVTNINGQYRQIQ